MATQVEALRKITVKEILKGKPETEAYETQENGEKVTRRRLKAESEDLMLLFGRARGHRVGNSIYGEFVEYIGVFEGVRRKDNITFQSTRLILPPPASDIFFNLYMEARGDDPDAVVDLATVIGVERSERGGEGYRFTCKPITDPTREAKDPLADLRTMLAEQVPELLPQPAKQIEAKPDGKAGKTSKETAPA